MALGNGMLPSGAKMRSFTRPLEASRIGAGYRPHPTWSLMASTTSQHRHKPGIHESFRHQRLPRDRKSRVSTAFFPAD